MKIVATIEARMGSSRRPGKSMELILGKPVQERIIERLRRSRYITEICMATTVAKADDVIADHMARIGVACYRGSEHDVMDRVIRAAEFVQADCIVECTGDCAVLDWEVIDESIEIYKQGGYDVVNNVHSNSYPLGIDTQVFSLKSLKEAALVATAPIYREHVSNFFYEHREKYRVFDMTAPAAIAYPNLRVMIDYEEDLAFIREIFARLYPQKPDFLTRDIISSIEVDPRLKAMARDLEKFNTF